MIDREKVISNLQGVYEYLRHFENTAKMGEWVADALAMIDAQYKLILELQNLNGLYIMFMDGRKDGITTCMSIQKERSIARVRCAPQKQIQSAGELLADITAWISAGLMK